MLVLHWEHQINKIPVIARGCAPGRMVRASGMGGMRVREVTMTDCELLALPLKMLPLIRTGYFPEI